MYQKNEPEQIVISKRRRFMALQYGNRDPDLFETYDFFAGRYDIAIPGIPGFAEQIVKCPQFCGLFQLDRDDFRQILTRFLLRVTAAGDIEFRTV